MPYMYFAKVNVNQDIIKVYNGEKSVKEILDKLWIANWADYSIRVTKADKDIDDAEFVKFIDVDKMVDGNYILGRIVKVFSDELAYYDGDRDTMEKLEQKKLLRQIPFYFDFSSEIVGFVPKRHFSRQKFLQYFQALLNEIYGDEMFHVEIKSDPSEFRKKVQQLKTVSSVEILLVAPNSNKSEFDALFGNNASDLMETGGTKYEQSIYAPPRSKEGLNMEAGIIQRAIDAVGQGFGILKAKGKDNGNEPKSVSSDKDAPVKRFIPRNSMDSLNELRLYGSKGVKEIIISALPISQLIKSGDERNGRK